MTVYPSVFSRKLSVLGTASVALAALALALVPASTATAATSLSGPLDLEAATPFAVLGSTAVTNTGVTAIAGDVGLSPGTAIDGFESAVVVGTIHSNDSVAAAAQDDLTQAFTEAGRLTPKQTGLEDLAGMSLEPGVYSGGAVSNSGRLTLAGDADSVWVFQVASSLNIEDTSEIVLTGEASSCNVFWRVSSSATIGDADFVGTVMASESISVRAGANIEGRLLASTGAVTLINDVIRRPTDCADASGTEIGESPEISAGSPENGTVGTPYSDTITAEGDSDISYDVTAGELPAGLTLDEETGAISGTPTESGSYTFTVTASSVFGPPDTAEYTIVIAAGTADESPADETPADNSADASQEAAAELAELAATGADPALLVGLATFFGAAGVLLLTSARRTSRRRSTQR